MVNNKNIDQILFLIFVIVLLFFVLSRKNKNLERFQNHLKPVGGYSKVAIVSMVTKQPDFEFWLKYHMDFLKLDYIFLRVEDSSEYKPLIKKYGNRIIATYHNKKDIDMKHNYQTIMDRQKTNVNNGIQKAKELGVDFIFHTDADELIYVEPNGNIPRDILLRQYLEKVHQDYSCIHFKNFEAMFKKNNSKCFNTNRFIDCKKGHCLSYANGKSCGRVKDDIRFHGPHYFSGKVHNMPDTQIAILHFDSCTYKQWVTKFDLLKDTNKKKLKEIPFPFYKNSIKSLKECGGDKKKEKTCNKKLHDYYDSQKVDPFDTKPFREMNYM